jgi:hypothetical protein
MAEEKTSYKIFTDTPQSKKLLEIKYIIHYVCQNLTLVDFWGHFGVITLKVTVKGPPMGFT